jgi:hypothetical protein
VVGDGCAGAFDVVSEKASSVQGSPGALRLMRVTDAFFTECVEANSSSSASSQPRHT